MNNITPIYICAKAAAILRQPLLWFLVLFFSSFINTKEIRSINNSPIIDSAINLENPNIELLQNKILQSINNFRTKNKLEKLTWSDTLFKSSQFHLINMQNKKFFDHDDPSDNKYPNLKIRVEKFSGNYQCLSENLIEYFPFKFNGIVIEYNIKKVKNKYQYIDSKTSKPLQILSYSELANKIVSNWELSPPHRQNMVNDNYKAIGIAISFPKYLQVPKILPIVVVSNFGGCD